jgi:hypothetical protein
LIHLSVVGHLDCFHNLAVVNRAAINMGVHMGQFYKAQYSLLAGDGTRECLHFFLRILISLVSNFPGVLNPLNSINTCMHMVCIYTCIFACHIYMHVNGLCFTKCLPKVWCGVAHL